MALIDLIKRDKRCKRLLKSLAEGAFRFECSKYIVEIRKLHTSHRSGEMTTKDIIQNFQTKMIGSALHTQANRSRVVQIKINAYRIHAKLDKHLGLIKQHLKSTYATQLSHLGGTAADRDSILSVILEPALAHVKAIKTVMDIADIAIDDLDKTSWMHKTLIGVMEQSSEYKAPKI